MASAGASKCILSAAKRQMVRVAGRIIEFRAGETIHTENSYKYTLASFTALARGAGWLPVAAWTDAAEVFFRACAEGRRQMTHDRGQLTQDGAQRQGVSVLHPLTAVFLTPMPFCEADPWRLQYFECVTCPADVNIPTEDSDAWVWYPNERWVYDKLAVAASQGLAVAPHGVPPPHYPVFSKPIVNLKGMGVGSRIIRSAAEYEESLAPGHMWMTLLDGRHVSTDVAVVEGEPRWWRHVTGVPGAAGTFDSWTVHAEGDAEIEGYCGAWISAISPATPAFSIPRPSARASSRCICA